MSGAVLFMESPLGRLAICEREGAICRLYSGTVPSQFPERETPLLRRAARLLAAFFAGEAPAFDLPLDPEGTAFQQRVWQALRAIPYGETRNYGEIAAALGQPGAARAVGMACNRNPILILTPCHRVIGKNGTLVGFGAGLDAKRFLLELEGIPYK